MFEHKNFTRARLRSEAKLRCFLHIQSVYTKQHFLEKKNRKKRTEEEKNKQFLVRLHSFSNTLLPLARVISCCSTLFLRRARARAREEIEKRECVREGKEEGFKTHLKTHIFRQTLD